MDQKVFTATGKRKKSIARIYLRPGSGKISVNGGEINDEVIWYKWYSWCRKRGYEL